MTSNLLKYIGFLVSFVVLSYLGACSADSQFTKRLAISPFIAELFGETTKTITLETDGCEHYAWLGLEWAADYKFFRIEEVTINGIQSISTGSGSTALFEDISVTSSNRTSGIIDRGDTGQILLKISYSPLKALEEVDKPHKAYLLAACDSPDIGIVRAELTGMVKGVCNPATEDCNAVDISSLVAKNYELSRDGDGDGTGDMALYLCDDPLIPNAGQANDPAHPGANLAYVNIEENFTFYLNASGSEVHIVRSDNQSVAPSVPEFGISVPPGTYDGVNISETFPPLPAGLADGQDVKCDVGSDGIFECSGVEIEVGGGVVGVDPLIVTNGTANPESTDCESFRGGISGSGSLSEDEITLIGWGVINNSPQVPSLVDALVVVEIPLKIAE